MNIEDFKPKIYSLEGIFAKQLAIKFQYEPKAEAIFLSFDIDVYEDQEVFKQYCWRIVEELMEALEDRTNENHFKEEVIDGFNFLIELYLLYGWGPEDLLELEQLNLFEFDCTTDIQILKVVYQLGITANLLKNRAWRQSQYLVDMHIFEPRFKQVWKEYMKLFRIIGLFQEDISKLWSLKYQVNKFRIETNY